MEVIQARLENLEAVSGLFDRYRVFYKASSDPERAKKFIAERLRIRDSTILIASDDDRIVGFTQLYPSFSSVSLAPIWILNDLFVDEAYRGNGVAKLLMSAAENFARETGAIRIVLATQTSNLAAQALYELRGYAKDKDFYHYALLL